MKLIREVEIHPLDYGVCLNAFSYIMRDLNCDEVYAYGVNHPEFYDVVFTLDGTVVHTEHELLHKHLLVSCIEDKKGVSNGN